MKIYQLSAEEQRGLGFSHKVVVDWNDLVGTAGLTKAQNIWPGSGNAAVGTCIRKGAVRVVTAFAGCTALVVELGYGTDPNAILASANVMATAGTWYAITPATCPIALSAADTFDALFTATTDNLSSLTAGEVEIYLDVADLSQLH